MSETRKIAAILCSDVVGYSQPAGADEERILARLKTLRSDMIDPTISVHEAWLHGAMTNRKILPGRGSVASPMAGSQDIARIAMRQSIKRLAFVASSLVIAGAAQAHDAWRNGDPIPAWVKSSCCGSSEAHLLSEEEVHHFDGYYIVDSFGPQHIPDSKVLPSQDDAYWGFWNPNSPPGARIMFCFFIPIKASEMTAYPPDSQSPTSMVAHSRSPAPDSAGPYEVSSGLR
jgi:hypothetical protein